jgi:hypothetical protein
MRARPLLGPGSGARCAVRWTHLYRFKAHPDRVESVSARFTGACPIRKAGSRYSGTSASRIGLRATIDKIGIKIDSRDAVVNFLRCVNYFIFKRHRQWHFSVVTKKNNRFRSRAPSNSPRLCYAENSRAVRPGSWEGERGRVHCAQVPRILEL